MLQSAGCFSEKRVYDYFVLPGIPSFHVPLSFGLSEELKEAQGGVAAQHLKVST